MQIGTGARIAQYEIASLIGRGGMGAVYRAHDTRLRRDVAIKLLPDDLTRDGERLARFDREARLLAALNHPHIASVHDFIDHDGGKVLVMELVEGETLETRMLRGAIPPDEAIAIARQIAEGLEAAHQKGIIHRDLKPANVMIAPDGRVKILDFGLARDLGGDEPQSEMSHSPTVQRIATHDGVILGTAGYMSPEQARGKRVDERSDIWALGVILWEMLAGRRLFEGETVTDVLASVLTREIDESALPATAPANLRWLLRRCLARTPRQRLHHAADVRILLDAEPIAEPRSNAAAPARSRLRLLALASLALVAIAAAAAAAVLLSRRAPEPLHVAIALPQGSRLALTGIQPGPPAISPDGTRVAAVLDGPERRRLWIRDLRTGEGRFLEGTEGASYPFWSWDGAHVGFFAGDKLKRVPAAGGTPLVIAHAPNAKGGTWNRDDVILFSATFASPISRVPASGGTPVEITKLDLAAGVSGHRFPQFLPDGNHFICLVRKRADRGHRTYLGALDGSVWKPLLDSDTNAFAAGNHLLFLRDGTLMAQPFDAKKHVLTGTPSPLASGVKAINAAARVVADATSGVLAFQRGEPGEIAQLQWVDRGGNLIATLGEPLKGPSTSGEDRALSPDGSRLAVILDRDVWLLDSRSGQRERVTFDRTAAGTPTWAPDGRRIAYASIQGTTVDIRIETIPPSGAPKTVISGDPTLRYAQPKSWSPDGSTILYEFEDSTVNSTEIRVLDLASGKTRRLAMTSVRVPDPSFSPDGRWITFNDLNGQGTPTVFVAAWPQFHRRWEIGPGGESFWRGDSTELYYRSVEGPLRAVTVQASEGNFAWRPAEELFAVDSVPTTVDGQRFLVAYDLGRDRSEPLDLIVNWQGMLDTKR